MKKYRNILWCMIAFMMCLCLNACGTSKKEPGKDMIKEDLTRELTAYNSELNFKDYSVEKSLIKEKKYVATLDVSAKNTYSEHQITTDVTYVLYDQGWKLEECKWTNDTYVIETYPTVDKMSELMKNTEELINKGFDQQQDINIQTNEKSLTCEGMVEKKDNPYYIFEGKIVTYWNYDEDTDEWEYSDNKIEEYKCELTSALQLNGTWESIMKEYKNDPSTYIIISNYDRNSMDIKSEMFNTNTVHAQLEECKLGQATYRGSGLSYQLHDGTVRDNIDFSVRVVIGDDYIQLSFQIEDPEYPNLTADTADIEGLS